MNFLDINKHKKRNIVDTISAVYILESYMKMKKDNWIYNKSVFNFVEIQ